MLACPYCWSLVFKDLRKLGIAVLCEGVQGSGRDLFLKVVIF